MKKKIVAILIATVVSFSILTACGSKVTTNNSSDLQAQIDKLEKENKELKDENETLKSQSTDTSTVDTNESTTSNEMQDYIKNNLVLTGAVVQKYDGYDGTKVGLGCVQIKNNGDKNLSEVDVTVYFQDNNGNNIFDSTFKVVGNSWDYEAQQELKANYSFKMEDDTFYTIENISSEVDITKYTVEITDVKFE